MQNGTNATQQKGAEAAGIGFPFGSLLMIYYLSLSRAVSGHPLTL